MSNFLSRFRTLLGVSLGICAATFTSLPAVAFDLDFEVVEEDDNPFSICAYELQDTGISENLIAYACGAALDPEELSECVARIDYYTPIEADNALYACYRVRRPLDLAECVVDINEKTANPNSVSTLDFCRRSLLPTRFSECVVGLTKRIDVTTDFAMATCIESGDFDRILFPTF